MRKISEQKITQGRVLEAPKGEGPGKPTSSGKQGSRQEGPGHGGEGGPNEKDEDDF